MTSDSEKNNHIDENHNDNFQQKNKIKILIISLILFFFFLNFNYLYFMQFNKKLLPLSFKTKYMILLKDETVFIIGNNSNKKQSVSCFLYNPKTNTLSKTINCEDLNINHIYYYLKDNGNVLFFTNTVEINSNEKKSIVKEFDILKNSFSVVDTLPKKDIIFTTVSELNKSTLFVITNENNYYFFDLGKNKFTQTNKTPFQITGGSESINIGNNKILIRTKIINYNDKEYEFVIYDANSKNFSPIYETEKMNRYSYYHLLKINDNDVLIYYPVYIWHPIATFANEYKKNIKKYVVNQNKIINAGSLIRNHHQQYGLLLPNNEVLFLGMSYRYAIFPPFFYSEMSKQNDGCEIYNINTMSSKKCKHCPVNLEIAPVMLKNGEIIVISSFRTGKGYQVIQKFHYSKLK